MADDRVVVRHGRRGAERIRAKHNATADLKLGVGFDAPLGSVPAEQIVVADSLPIAGAQPETGVRLPKNLKGGPNDIIVL